MALMRRRWRARKHNEINYGVPLRLPVIHWNKIRGEPSVRVQFKTLYIFSEYTRPFLVTDTP